MIRALDIAGAIEEFAPLKTQAEWDNSGFQVGDPNAVVHKALTALNCSLEVVREALDRGCDMLLTHHPLIIHKPCLSILKGDVRGDTIMEALRGGLTIYSSHTPLDKAEGGLNTIMAEKLSLAKCSGLSEDGFGVIGSLPKALEPEELIAMIKKVFGAKNIRCSKPLRGKISRVAVSSGGGQSSLEAAIEKGAQALVTGDVTHHNYYTPEGFMIFDIGHFESEYPAIGLLSEIVKKKFSNFALFQSKKDKTTIYYY